MKTLFCTFNPLTWLIINAFSIVYSMLALVQNTKYTSKNKELYTFMPYISSTVEPHIMLVYNTRNIGCQNNSLVISCLLLSPVASYVSTWLL